MNTGDRIKKKRLEYGLTLKELAEKIGVQEATVQRYESGNIKTIKPDTIAKIADYFAVNPAWLVGWEEAEESMKVVLRPEIPLLPVVQEIVPEAKLLDRNNIISFAPADVINGNEYFYYLVSDDTMISAGLEKAATVLFHRQKSAADGQIIACVMDGKAGFLKRFKQMADSIVLLSENPSIEPIILKSSDFLNGHVVILGVAVQCVIIKKL